ncbi:MAG: dienelactone hydrolase family protein [Caldilineae bacterium]|nr:dienelactone hydrolase family protein [Chloroflexota bacterium]MCB9176074.1 dienelactone hydrolase family protein [Caldilineae bacterium]
MSRVAGLASDRERRRFALTGGLALLILLGLASPSLGRTGFPRPHADTAAPGATAAGWRHVDVQRPSGDTFGALLFYPALEAGPDAAFDASGGPYPGIAFGHGFAQTPDRYDGTLAFLAARGYLVIAPESYSAVLPAPDHAAFAEDLRLALDWLEQAGAGALPAARDLAGAVDGEAFGLSGHSMGGGAAILAAARDPRVRALAPMAPAETSPSAIAAMAALEVPALLLAGSEDAITPLAQHAGPLFEAGRYPRLLPVIRGGSHCGFQDRPFPLFCDAGSLDREAQLALARRILGAFFDLQLEQDGAGWREVWGPELLEDPALETRVESGLELSVIMPLGQAERDARPEKPSDGIFLRNVGPLASRYAVAVDEAGWLSRPSVDRTPELAPGDSFALHLEVELPPNTPGSASDRALVSFQPEAHPGVRAYLWLRTGSGEGAGERYVPWAGRH